MENELELMNSEEISKLERSTNERLKSSDVLKGLGGLSLGSLVITSPIWVGAGCGAAYALLTDPSKIKEYSVYGGLIGAMSEFLGGFYLLLKGVDEGVSRTD